MKTICVIQARLGSTRLPGKVLMDLGGKPVLAWVVRACKAAVGVDEVWVATTKNPEDKAITDWCEVNDTEYLCGSETDVLSRFMDVQKETNAEILLRVTGDEPFTDPSVISAILRLRHQTGADYCSNIHPRTYADGLDVECFTARALIEANNEATRPVDRDTVTYWIWRNQARYRAETVVNPILGQDKERWVLDTAQDYEFCKAIAERWPWEKGPPSQFDILTILEKEPDLRKLNAGHIMNERFYEAISTEVLPPRNYPGSRVLLAQAERAIPLGTQTFSKSKLQFPAKHPLFVTHGEGAYVYDVDGNEYVDLIGALLPNILGYGDSDVDYAIRRQLNRGISLSLSTELEYELASLLRSYIPCAEMVRFGKTGTDVTTAAVRLARAYTGHTQVIMVKGGYHGWGDWSVAQDDLRNKGVPFYSGMATVVCEPDITVITDALKASPCAALIIEPEGRPKFLEELRYQCTKTGALLIFDEIITGFRWGMGGAQKLYGVTPDLACFGKAMANGMPISALVGKKEIMQLMEKVCFSGTFFGETLSLAAAIATIMKLAHKDVAEHLRKVEQVVFQRVRLLIESAGLQDAIQISARPLLRLTFKTPEIKALFMQTMASQGVLIIASHNFSYAHKEPQIQRIMLAYDYTLQVIRDALDKGDINQRIGDTKLSPTVREVA